MSSGKVAAAHKALILLLSSTQQVIVPHWMSSSLSEGSGKETPSNTEIEGVKGHRITYEVNCKATKSSIF